MVILLALLVIIIIIVAIVKANGSNDSKIDTYYTSGYNNLWLESRKGYSKFGMVGMYYRKLKRSNMGKFEGYAKAEKYNTHDPYAVAIYTSSGKHVGYLPKGNKSIHNLILENGNSLPAYGYISCDAYGSNFIGEVGIKTNTSLNIDNPFYDQSITIIGKFNVTQKELSEILGQMGAYISNSVHEHTDIVLIGEKIKGTKMLEKMELLINQGYNIRKIYKDEFEKMLNENK